MTEQTESSTKVTVSCPDCSANNELEQHRSIGCTKCDKPITGNRYGVKASVPSVLLFVAGFSSYSFVDRFFLDVSRYPLAIEYAMVNACVNGDMSPLPRELYGAKQEVCICVVEKVVEELPYSEVEEKIFELQQILANRVNECW